MKIKISADSTCDLPKDLAAKYGIGITPLYVVIDGRELRDGADWIKILTSHRTHTPEYTQEELNAAVDECHRRGVKICVHAGTHPSIQMCIDAGFDTIEHGTFMTREQAVQMRDKGIAWVPTIIAYTYIYEQLCDAATREAVAGGIDGSGLSDFDYFKAAAEAFLKELDKSAEETAKEDKADVGQQKEAVG